MDKKKWFTISSWVTVIFGILVIFDAFNYWIAPFELYFYLILVAGIIGIVGAILSLGIFSMTGGIVICGALIYFSSLYGIPDVVLFSFIKAVCLLIGGGGMILTYEEAFDSERFEIARLGMNKTEYFALKDLGINTISDLLEEKGNEEEICSITSILLTDFKGWIEKAEKLLQEHEDRKKTQLRRDYKEKFR